MAASIERAFLRPRRGWRRHRCPRFSRRHHVTFTGCLNSLDGETELRIERTSEHARAELGAAWAQNFSPADRPSWMASANEPKAWLRCCRHDGWTLRCWPSWRKPESDARPTIRGHVPRANAPELQLQPHEGTVLVSSQNALHALDWSGFKSVAWGENGRKLRARGAQVLSVHSGRRPCRSTPWPWGKRARLCGSTRMPTVEDRSPGPELR